MKRVRDANACMAVLQAVLRGNDIQPEQKQNIETAIKRLKILKKLNRPTRAQIFREVREIIDRILQAILNSRPNKLC